jgi:hypothetical protein
MKTDFEPDIFVGTMTIPEPIMDRTAGSDRKDSRIEEPQYAGEFSVVAGLPMDWTIRLSESCFRSPPYFEIGVQNSRNRIDDCILYP